MGLLQDARAALQMKGEGMLDSGSLHLRHAWALARCEEALLSGLLDNADRKARTCIDRQNTCFVLATFFCKDALVVWWP